MRNPIVLSAFILALGILGSHAKANSHTKANSYAASTCRGFGGASSAAHRTFLGEIGNAFSEYAMYVTCAIPLEINGSAKRLVRVQVRDLNQYEALTCYLSRKELGGGSRKLTSMSTTAEGTYDGALQFSVDLSPYSKPVLSVFCLIPARDPQSSSMSKIRSIYVKEVP